VAWLTNVPFALQIVSHIIRILRSSSIASKGNIPRLNLAETAATALSQCIDLVFTNITDPVVSWLIDTLLDTLKDFNSPAIPPLLWTFENIGITLIRLRPITFPAIEQKFPDIVETIYGIVTQYAHLFVTKQKSYWYFTGSEMSG